MYNSKNLGHYNNKKTVGIEIFISLCIFYIGICLDVFFNIMMVYFQINNLCGDFECSKETHEKEILNENGSNGIPLTPTKEI